MATKRDIRQVKVWKFSVFKSENPILVSRISDLSSVVKWDFVCICLRCLRSNGSRSRVRCASGVESKLKYVLHKVQRTSYSKVQNLVQRSSDLSGRKRQVKLYDWWNWCLVASASAGTCRCATWNSVKRLPFSTPLQYGWKHPLIIRLSEAGICGNSEPLLPRVRFAPVHCRMPAVANL